MSDSIEIRVPRDIVNDDFVTVVEWKVETGDHVSPGDIVVLVETAKSILEIQAESAGTDRRYFGCRAPSRRYASHRTGRVRLYPGFALLARDCQAQSKRP